MDMRTERRKEMYAKEEDERGLKKKASQGIVEYKLGV